MNIQLSHHIVILKASQQKIDQTIKQFLQTMKHESNYQSVNQNDKPLKPILERAHALLSLLEQRFHQVRIQHHHFHLIIHTLAISNQLKVVIQI
jgi:hypothetical protein